ncbi:Pectin lyase fold [Phytophthora cactorum]|nr:Pectin lyase fold [Phytophthora cactorum]
MSTKSNTDCLAKNNGFKGQDVILFPSDTTLTRTGGNKTLRGVGKKGVLKGKGLKLEGDNIIIQNVHITELNAQYVWGGDAIFLGGINNRALKNIWIDHVKISRVGRQMFVSGFDGVESITISNSDFDGRMTGRVPVTVVTTGGSFWTPGKNAFVLAEGNFFEGTLKPMQADADDCRAALGRSCPGNTVEKSGKLESVNGARALETVKKYKEITGYKPGEATQLSESADNFGVGTLGDSPSQGEVNQSNEPQSEANVKQEDSAPVANGTGSQPINGTSAPRSSVQQGSE